MITTRRFEYIGGTSAKFYEVTCAARTVSIRFGRIGTNGQSQSRSFQSDAEAQKYAAKQCDAKLAKGYLELVQA